MRIWGGLERMGFIFIKSLRQISRDRLVLILTLIFAPLFVFLYYMITAGGSTTYGVVVVNLDDGVSTECGYCIIFGHQVEAALEAVTYADGQSILRVLPADSQAEAMEMIRRRAGVVFIIIPSDFSHTLLSLKAGDPSPPIRLTFGGDLTNPYYMVAGVMALSAIESYVGQVTGQTALIAYDERALGASGVRTEFEIYMPGILIFAILMLIFLAAMTAVREAEAGTLRRLQLTQVTVIEFLGGLSGALVLVGLTAEFLAFGTAVLCGFHSAGPLWVAILVGALTSLGMVGTGLIVAAFSRNSSQAFVIANFPLGLFMFFSGTIYPLPRVELFKVGEQAIGLYDILAPTHAVSALNKVFVMGAGVSEVSYELISLAVLSAIYFAVGTWVFKRRHLRAG